MLPPARQHWMLRLNLEGQASHLLPDISGTSMSSFATSALLPVSQVLLCMIALTRTWLSSLVFLPQGCRQVQNTCDCGSPTRDCYPQVASADGRCA